MEQVLLPPAKPVEQKPRLPLDELKTEHTELDESMVEHWLGRATGRLGFSAEQACLRDLPRVEQRMPGVVPPNVLQLEEPAGGSKEGCKTEQREFRGPVEHWAVPLPERSETEHR